jgi:hypothetical protein
MPLSDRAVVQFIRDVLGCGCPDDVLQEIRIDRPWHVDGIDAQLARIDAGGRLLVWVVAVDDRQPALAELVTAAVAAALDERDRMAFNRLRLVLATAVPFDISGPARQAFDACRCRDDRIHVHVVDRQSVPPSVRPAGKPSQS